ncbi:nucleolin-like isoform X2 [Abrus precatorius]|uniref:Nucleolin-like isoform X2 n=1 Tax=Abrus precatorius TaxID=3816 RepID=A0A8B8KN60_ABRPR|nr:nucleolin-like isoform X2 [Abrus precatorius]
MRTRNADSSSKSATPKKTPPARKSAAKTTAESAAVKRTPATKTRSIKKKEASPAPGSNLDQSPLEQKSLASASTTKSIKKRTPGRPRTKVIDIPDLEEQLEAVADETPIEDNLEPAGKVEEPRDVEVVNADDVEGEKKGEQGVGSVKLYDEKEQKSLEVDEPVVENVCKSGDKGKGIMDIEVTASQDASITFKRSGRTIVDLNISADNEDCTGEKEGEEELTKEEGKKGNEGFNKLEGEKGKEELKDQEGEKGKEDLKDQEGEKGKEELMELKGEKGREEYKEQEAEKGKEELKEQGQKGKGELKELERDKGKQELKEEEPDKGTREETYLFGQEENTESFGVEMKAQMQDEDDYPKKDGVDGPKNDEKLDLGEQGTEELVEEDPEEDPEEPQEETEAALEEEHRELEAIAKQRKIRKEHEIFVGGLDRDATEEDLRKVFQRIGEIVEVRLHKNSSTNKNKGYAFVKFANKEHAKKALSEMKNPVIHGKRCGTAPSEDNDTLFLGNICNTWTKEAIKQKLIDYGIEGVESITLVPDVQHEGMSRGFAFLEFSCHADAMLAYKRLQKPDVIFGHAERTAKVAFAEPIREPDPEIMAQVKSVFINGLPLHWDEDLVRELFKSYGEIIRIVLARNMSTAKRKDYGFVDFSTHEAAVACVDGVNKSELGDGASKIKVRARLSNPLPKTQAVKGGMCGGFRIGHARSGAFPRSGRGFGRGRQPFNNWGNFNRDRTFYHDGHSQIGRMAFRDTRDFSTYPDFRQRQFGTQGSRGAAFAGPSRPYNDRAWYGIPDGGPSEPIPPRGPYSPGGQFDMPFMGRHFDDPYLYDGNMHAMKRPFYMTDPEPDYMGPNRHRPRLDYADPPIFHGTHHHDSFGSGNRQYPPDYYGSDYGRGPYSSYYGGDGSHGHGYYY